MTIEKIISINLAELTTLDYQHKQVQTGIYKQAVNGPVAVHVEGLAGDIQVDRVNHGGPDKAIYVYSQDNYPYWEHYMQTPAFSPGQFGENLTVSGMGDDVIHIGDIIQFGEVLTEVTQPRVPCFKLGIKMGDKSFVGTFLTSGRVGFYVRILKTGHIRPGDTIERKNTGPSALTIRDAMLALVKGQRQQDVIRQALAIPALSLAWRNDLERRLRKD